MLTVNDILKDPVTHDKNEVEICGVYVNGREHRAIYSTRDDVKKKYGIWLVQEASGGESAVKKLNGKNVRVVGTFHNRSKSGAGHFNGWPAELRNIKVFETINETNT
jgi:hypothetical protein